jgi:hypothetical protein
MSLAERLTERRAEVLARWRDLAAEVGPRAAARARPRGDDPFHDPVGAALRRATEALYDAVCGAGPQGRADAALDELVRIRSVQELSPSQAVGFALLLRRAVRDALGAALEREDRAEREALDLRIDALALQAFDAFIACREKVFALRAREAVSSSYLLLRRARLVDGAAPPAPAGDGGGAPPIGGPTP